LTSATRWLNGGTSPKTQYVYDGNGLRITMIDPKGNQTQYTPDGTGAFYSQIQYPTTGSVQHIEYFTHDSNTGLLTQFKDQNNNATTYSPDCMLRPLSVTYPDGGQEGVTYNYSGGAGCSGATGLTYTDATHTKKINASQHLSQNSTTDR